MTSSHPPDQCRSARASITLRDERVAGDGNRTGRAPSAPAHGEARPTATTVHASWRGAASLRDRSARRARRHDRRRRPGRSRAGGHDARRARRVFGDRRRRLSRQAAHARPSGSTCASTPSAATAPRRVLQARLEFAIDGAGHRRGRTPSARSRCRSRRTARCRPRSRPTSVIESRLVLNGEPQASGRAARRGGMSASPVPRPRDAPLRLDEEGLPFDDDAVRRRFAASPTRPKSRRAWAS